MTLGHAGVEGYLLSFNRDSILGTLDRLEDYEEQRSLQENEYYRQLIAVYDSSRKPLGEAWAYLMITGKVEQLGGVMLPSGRWNSSHE